jgi:hypothetical protein
MILCDSSNPGVAGDVYTLPYSEAVEGYRHGYEVRGRSRITGREWSKGVTWTRNADHPEDPRCPECRAIVDAEEALLAAAEALENQPPKLREQYVATLRLYAAEPWRLPRPTKEPRVHVPNERLARYRRIIELYRHVDRIGNARSNRGDYAGANRAWTRADAIRSAAQELRVPGKKGK